MFQANSQVVRQDKVLSLKSKEISLDVFKVEKCNDMICDLKKVYLPCRVGMDLAGKSGSRKIHLRLSEDTSHAWNRKKKEYKLISLKTVDSDTGKKLPKGKRLGSR